jgi:hypothetical protein
MSQQQDDANAARDDVLRKGVRQIVLSRETIPRAPRWARAFRRTLLRFVHEIAEAEAAESESGAPEVAPNIPPEEINHDQR